MITITIEPSGRHRTRVIRDGKEWTGNYEQMKEDDRPLGELLGIKVTVPKNVPSSTPEKTAK